MGRGPTLSIEKHAAVIALRNDDRSVRYIVIKLNIPWSTVNDAITCFQRTGVLLKIFPNYTPVGKLFDGTVYIF